MSENQIDLSSFLSTDLSQVEDLPEFITPLNGKYLVKGEKFDASKTTTKNKPKVALMFALLSVAELEQTQPENIPTTEAHLKEGALMYFTVSDEDPAKLVAKLKKIFGETLAENNIDTIAEMADQFTNLEFLIEVKSSASSDDPNRFFSNINKATIA